MIDCILSRGRCFSEVTYLSPHIIPRNAQKASRAVKIRHFRTEKRLTRFVQRLIFLFDFEVWLRAGIYQWFDVTSIVKMSEWRQYVASDTRSQIMGSRRFARGLSWGSADDCFSFFLLSFWSVKVAQDVCKYTTSKRIELESPGWSGFVENSKPDQTWPTGTF